ncbi:MAG: integrase [Parasporobacterium sp.]|nr:integrase [Parasporobacterium sp.]
MTELEQTSINEQLSLPEIPEDPQFSYDGYQVVRGEFFAHLFEPSVTLGREKVSVNAACLRRLPDVDYVQFLVNPVEKKLAIKPCEEDRKDSFRWCSGEGKNRKPKSISCRIFFAKIMTLMGWNPEYRYKILGKLIRTESDLLYVFDLSSAETFGIRSVKGKISSRTAIYPEEWKNQFGLPFNEHQDTVQVSIFDDYAVFRIDRDEENIKENKNGTSSDPNSFVGHEEKTNQDSQADITSAG